MADDRGTITTERRPHTFERTHRRPGMIRLRVLEGPQPAPDKLRWRRRRITGGRGEAADLTLDDALLSGQHFELCLRGEHVWLKDLGSTNGTWLGDHRVGEVGLPPGSTFTAGGCKIQLVGVDTVEVPICPRDHFGQMLGRSTVMRELFAQLETLATSGMEVVLHGETGTGKELAARALHQHSSRYDGPFVVLDCTTLSPTLVNATLFGHAAGAFTDAREDRPGCFEQADGGTLFIDEVGDLPPALQPKLLRVLDRREVVRIGETRPRRVDVQVMAATHRDLRRMVAEGRFRRDLFHRLSHVIVWLPPLRERGDDVLFLARRFAQEQGGPGYQLPEAFERELRSRMWPGNVRELQQAIHAAVALAGDRPPRLQRLEMCPRTDGPTLREMHTMEWSRAHETFERGYLAELMRVVDGNLSKAERRSGISRKSLRARLRRHGLRE